MTNFAKKIEEASENDLLSWVNQLDFRVVPLASDELTRRTLNKLRETIVDLDKKNGELQKKIFYLTVATFVLTATQIVQVVDTIRKWF